MFNAGSILIPAAVLLIVVFFLVLPLQLAAQAMGAKRYGVGVCLLSLIAASFMQVLGMSVPGYGTVAAFLLSSAAFAAILGTTFLRGIGISILHAILSAALVFLLVLVFGLGFAGLIGR
jgi:hypothetical protein